MIRAPFDKMDEFITKFEKKVADLIRCGTDLPQVVLAMQIVVAANITDKEKQIVLTAVDYSKKDQNLISLKVHSGIFLVKEYL